MIRRRSQIRRRRSTRGFVLAEALVSLAVAAMTLALLAGAAWGLRTLAAENARSGSAGAELLTARRVMQAWAAAANPGTSGNTPAAFAGTAEQLRIALHPQSGQPFVAALQIRRDGGQSILLATRDLGQTDIRLMSPDPRTSVVLRDPRALRLAYLVTDDDGVGRVWRYETDMRQGLPFAIALEAGTDFLVIAPILGTLGSDCVAAARFDGLEGRQCRLR